jgi:hypothetical protein
MQVVFIIILSLQLLGDCRKKYPLLCRSLGLISIAVAPPNIPDVILYEAQTNSAANNPTLHLRTDKEVDCTESHRDNKRGAKNE